LSAHLLLIFHFYWIFLFVWFVLSGFLDSNISNILQSSSFFILMLILINSKNLLNGWINPRSGIWMRKKKYIYFFNQIDWFTFKTPLEKRRWLRQYFNQIYIFKFLSLLCFLYTMYIWLFLSLDLNKLIKHCVNFNFNLIFQFIRRPRYFLLSMYTEMKVT
jgi:hypothetical protein